MHLVCPTCCSDNCAEFYQSERSGSGFQVYCRRCEEGCVDAVDTEKSAPRHQLWRIRKKLPDGMFSAGEYTAPTPVTSADVAKAPSVLAWLGANTLVEIYHPA